MPPLLSSLRIRTCFLFATILMEKSCFFSPKTLSSYHPFLLRVTPYTARHGGLTVHYYNTIRLLPVDRLAVGERVAARACVRTYEILYVCLEREPNRVRSYVWRRRRLSMLNSRRRIFSLGRVAA